jgi:GST-like protein
MSSHNVYKVAIMLEECGLEYSLRHVNVWSGEQFTPEFRAISPNCKVPAIIDHDGPGGAPFALSESGAILLYLADKSGVLAPSGAAERARVLQWMLVQVGSIGPMFGQLNHFGLYAPPESRSDYAFKRYLTEASRLLDVLQTRLAESRYLASDDYSLADIMTFPRIKRAHKALLDVDPERHPAIVRWLAEIDARPAVLRGIARVEEAWGADGQIMKSADPEGLDQLFGRGRYARG